MRYQIDPAHSDITFSVRHLGLASVKGRFERFSGFVDFDEANPTAARAEVTIEADSINTRDTNRDTHLRSADFLDAEHFPALTFRSTRIELDSTEGKVEGELTIHGVTRPVVLEVEYLGATRDPWGGQRAGFHARTRINRRDFGLTWNAAIETGALIVGEEVRIDIDVEAVHQIAQPAAASTSA